MAKSDKRYNERSIIKITNFQFDSDSDTKSRYVLILRKHDGKILFVTLSTKQFNPDKSPLRAGLNKNRKGEVLCYRFIKNKSVGMHNGWSFPMTCNINLSVSASIFEAEESKFKALYDADCEFQTILEIKPFYKDIVYGVYRSKGVTKKFKIILEKDLERDYGPL